MVRFSGNPNWQQISRKVNRANVSLDVGAFAAAATIVLVVRSTQVTIQLLPNLVVGNDPIKSKAQLVIGWTGIVDNCGIPRRWWLLPLEAAQVGHDHTKCETSACNPGQ